MSQNGRAFLLGLRSFVLIFGVAAASYRKQTRMGPPSRVPLNDILPRLNRGLACVTGAINYHPFTHIHRDLSLLRRPHRSFGERRYPSKRCSRSGQRNHNRGTWRVVESKPYNIVGGRIPQVFESWEDLKNAKLLGNIQSSDGSGRRGAD